MGSAPLQEQVRAQKDLARHVQQAHKPFTCRLCSYATLREEALLSHVEKDHTRRGLRDAAKNGKPERRPRPRRCAARPSARPGS